MKIHTAEKYCRSLSELPSRSLIMKKRFRTLNTAVSIAMGVRTSRLSSIAVIGRDGDYAVDILSRVFFAAGVDVAVADPDTDTLSADAVSVNGVSIGNEEAAEILTVIRREAVKLGADDPEGMAGLTRFEVRLAFIMCACARHGVGNVILKIDTDKVISPFAALLPVPSCVLVTSADLNGVNVLRSLCGGQTHEIVCAPQNEDINRNIAALCAELNCRHNMVARSQLEMDDDGFVGTRFRYRGIEAVSKTCFSSTVGASAAAIETVRGLKNRGIGIGDERIARAISASSVHGRGSVLSIAPAVIGCVGSPENISGDTALAANIARVCLRRGAEANIILPTEIANRTVFAERMAELTGMGCSVGMIAVVGERQSISTEVFVDAEVSVDAEVLPRNLPGNLPVDLSAMKIVRCADADEAFSVLYAPRDGDGAGAKSDSNNKANSNSNSNANANANATTNICADACNTSQVTFVLGDRQLVERCAELSGKYGKR